MKRVWVKPIDKGNGVTTSITIGTETFGFSLKKATHIPEYVYHRCANRLIKVKPPSKETKPDKED